MMDYMILPFVYSKCHWAEVYRKPDKEKIKMGDWLNHTDTCRKCGNPCEKVTQAEINQEVKKAMDRLSSPIEYMKKG